MYIHWREAQSLCLSQVKTAWCFFYPNFINFATNRYPPTRAHLEVLPPAMNKLIGNIHI